MGKTDQKETSEDNEKVTYYKPTRQQMKWLESALKPEVPPLISEIAKDCGVRREQWYVWIKGNGRHKGFIDWWHKVWEEGMKRADWYLDKVGLQKATKDYRYWEGMQMKYQKFKRQESVEVSVSDQIKDHFANLTNKLKNEMEDNKGDNK